MRIAITTATCVLVGMAGCRSRTVPPGLAGRPSWLFSEDRCPADVFPANEVPVVYGSSACATDLQACVDRCRAAEANACYATALRLDELKGAEEVVQALYLRACRLGIPSGCTNRAAGLAAMEHGREDLWPCVNRTIEAMCERKDPWACTMWGTNLARGRGTRRDLARAREALLKGCGLGEKDRACLAAQKRLKEIEAPAKPPAAAPLPW